MSKILQNNSKRNYSLPFLNKIKTKRLFFLLIFTLVFIGFLAGHLPTVFSKKYNLNSKAFKPDESKSTKTLTVTRKYKFINPAISSATFYDIFYDKLNDFSDVISYYCENTVKKHNVESISYYFRDLTNGFTIKYNENEKFIPASLSKVPLLIAVFQKAEKNPAFLSKKIKYNISFEESYLAEHPELGHQRSFLKDGNYYSISELCNYMISKSDNEATLMLFKELGNEALAETKKKLRFIEPKDVTASTNTVTVSTYSHFFRTLYNASLLSPEYSDKALEILSHADFYEGIRKAVPSDIVVSQKFGERDTLTSPTTMEIRQLHQAGIVYYPGKHYFICIMTKGNNKKALEQVLFDLANITHKEIENQASNFKISHLEKDIND